MSFRPRPRSIVAESIYGLLNPIPFGCFVAALIFDLIYSETAVMLWDKGAAWLIVFGLLADDVGDAVWRVTAESH